MCRVDGMLMEFIVLDQGDSTSKTSNGTKCEKGAEKPLLDGTYLNPFGWRTERY